MSASNERAAIAGGELGRATAEKVAVGGVTPRTVAGIIVYLISDATAPVSGAIVPAYGA